MRNIKARLARLEKRIDTKNTSATIVAFSDEEAKQKLENFNHEFPGQQEPMILLVGFVEPGDLEKENENG